MNGFRPFHFGSRPALLRSGGVCLVTGTDTIGKHDRGTNFAVQTRDNTGYRPSSTVARFHGRWQRRLDTTPATKKRNEIGDGIKDGSVTTDGKLTVPEAALRACTKPEPEN